MSTIASNAANNVSTNAGGPDATASEQFAGYAHDAVNRVAEAAATAESRLREASADAEKALKLKSGELKERARNTLSRAETVARDKPLLVAGAALATGFVLGKLLSR